MSTAHASPLVESPYATYDLPMTLILWAAVMANFKTSPSDSQTATAYAIEVSTEESKFMTNSINDIGADISMNGQKIEEVTSFKYLGVTLCKNGTCSAEVRIRIASACRQ